MNFATYLRLFRRWFWLIGLAVLASGGAAYYVAHNQAPVYQATVTMQVGNLSNRIDPESAATLANSYFVIIRTRPVLESIIKESGLSIAPDDLTSAFTTNMITGTPFFAITVTDKD